MPKDDRPPKEGDGLDRSALEEPAEDEVMTEGRDRAELAESIELNPLSLVGSWFLRIEATAPTQWGIVVGEPQAGCYLIEIHDNGSPVEQKLVPITYLVVADTNDVWSFFNTEEAMRSAYWAAEARREEDTRP
jgi:hypothetical protein